MEKLKKKQKLRHNSALIGPTSKCVLQKRRFYRKIECSENYGSMFFGKKVMMEILIKKLLKNRNYVITRHPLVQHQKVLYKKEALFPQNQMQQ